MKRHRLEESAESNIDRSRREKHWFSKGERKSTTGTSRKEPSCIFCKENHWGDECYNYETLEKRKKFFVERRLCFNCGKSGHRESKCNSRGCLKCKSRHNTSLCDKGEQINLTGYTRNNHKLDQKTLPAIVPAKIQGQTFWAHLDTGAGRDFISKDAVNKLNLKPVRHETRHLVTVNGTRK